MKFKLKPEINDWKYWLHLILISAIVLGLLELFISSGMFSIKNIVISALFIGIADVIAHSLLGLD